MTDVPKLTKTTFDEIVAKAADTASTLNIPDRDLPFNLPAVDGGMADHTLGSDLDLLVAAAVFNTVAENAMALNRYLIGQLRLRADARKLVADLRALMASGETETPTDG
jgi:hypothetical protein